MSIFSKTEKTSGKKSIRERFYEAIAAEMYPSRVAGGGALGILIAFSPFYFFHFILAVLLSLLFRLNKLTTVLGTFLNNPYTLAPILVIEYRFGIYLTGMKASRKALAQLIEMLRLGDFGTIVHFLGEHVKTIGYPFAVGSITLALIMGAVSYFPIYFLVKRIKMRQMQMTVTGESPANDGAEDR